MRRPSVRISLITRDNDFQREQSAAAEAAGVRLGMDVRTVYADNDAITQSQQLLQAIHNKAERPDAILVEPVGTGMPRVARAVIAGIAWGVVNREVDYLPELRRIAAAPVFAVSTNHTEVGQIQAKQFSALLGDEEGTILYIEGPGTGSVAPLRAAAMKANRPPRADVKTLKGDWTELSAFRAVRTWLSLSTSRALHVRIVGCQNDAMAMGARKAFLEAENSREWLSLPFTGCDGVPSTGQKWVRQGLLTATVLTPPPMALAMQTLWAALRSGSQPSELTASRSQSFPAIEALVGKPLACGQHA